MLLTGNPIFRREFLSSCRAWKSRILISSYLLALAALLLLLWPAGGVHSVVTENTREIFSMFFGINLLLLMLIVPAFASGAITQERENETYHALFITPLTPFQIMIGKLCSSVLMLLILTILALPMASMCALTGGLDLPRMLKISSILFTAAVAYGLIGLACSSVCKRTSSSIFLTYVYLILFSGATWLPNALLANLLPSLSFLWQGIRSISPFDALAFLLYPEQYRSGMAIALTEGSTAAIVLDPYHLYLFFSGVIIIVAFSIFYRNVKRPPQSGKVQKGNVYTEKKIFIKRKLTFPFYLLDPLRRKKPIGRFRNPVFVAEMRSKLFSNPQFVLRSVSAILIISILLMTLIAAQFTEQLDANAVRVAAILFQLGVVTLLAPGVSSSLITEEISCGTFQALRMTTLSPLTLIVGKLKATFFYAMIFIFSGILVFITMTYLQVQDAADELSVFTGKFWEGLSTNINNPEWCDQFANIYLSLFVWIGILLLTTLVCLCAGLFASSIARNTPQATAFSYGFTGFLCVVTLLPLPLAGKLTHGAAVAILAWNPFVTAIQTSSNMFREYPLFWRTHLCYMLLLIVILLAAAFFRVLYLFRKQN